MSLCTERTVVNEGPSEGTYATLRCKRWSCPHCIDINRRRVVERARDGNPNIFMTLTWNANRPETPDQAARAMKHAWVLLRRRIERTYRQKNTPFIVVFERTKKGYPHMHILMRSRYIKQQWLSEQMADLIDAPIIDIRAIKDRKHAFFYITKYLGKDLAAFEGCKRWWRSHNYEVETEDAYRPVLFGQRIEIVDISWNIMKSRVMNGGYDIVAERKGWLHFKRRLSGGFDPTFGGKVHREKPKFPTWPKFRLPMVGDGWKHGNE